MATSPMSMVIRQLLAACGPDEAALTDGELLTRFLNGRDNDALAALVRRHASLVWGVCSRLLPDRHDAEDAFQTTFLVLVRKAATVKPREMVANWLYGVARQTAIRLRAMAAKRAVRERQVVKMPEPSLAEARDDELLRLLDEGLCRLPEQARILIVLCDLEGKTRKEAARQLGCPEGTIASRLARARAKLAKWLGRHGVAVSGGTLALMMARGAASGCAPAPVVAATIHAASLTAAGQAAGAVSVKVAALTEGVVKSMFVTKIKTVLAVLLVAGVIVLPATGFAYRALAGEPTPTEKKVAPFDPPAKDREEEQRAEEKPDLPRLQAEVMRLRARNEELKKRLQQQVRKGKADDVKLAVKVYPVVDLLGVVDPDLPYGAEARPLIQAITKTIEPTSWFDMGGDGSIQYVREAGSLVIRQTPDTHKQVQELLEVLDSLRKNRADRDKADQKNVTK